MDCKTLAYYGAVLKGMRGSGYNVCVVGVPPAGRQENIYKYPSYGTPGQRSEISRKFNAKLSEFCRREGFAFIDVYSKACDSEGFILPEYAGDEVHLNSKIAPHVSEQLNRAFGLGL